MYVYIYIYTYISNVIQYNYAQHAIPDRHGHGCARGDRQGRVIDTSAADLLVVTILLRDTSKSSRSSSSPASSYNTTSRSSR